MVFKYKYYFIKWNTCDLHKYKPYSSQTHIFLLDNVVYSGAVYIVYFSRKRERSGGLTEGRADGGSTRKVRGSAKLPS